MVLVLQCFFSPLAVFWKNAPFPVPSGLTVAALQRHLCVKALVESSLERSTEQTEPLSDGLKTEKKCGSQRIYCTTRAERREAAVARASLDADTDVDISAAWVRLLVAVADPGTDNTQRQTERSTRAAATPASELGFSALWEVSARLLRLAARPAPSVAGSDRFGRIRL